MNRFFLYEGGDYESEELKKAFVLEQAGLLVLTCSVFPLQLTWLDVL